MDQASIENKFLKISSLLAILTLIPISIGFLGFLTVHPILQNYVLDAPTINLETMFCACLIIFSIIQFNRLSFIKKDLSDIYRQRAKGAVLLLITMIFGTLLLYFLYYHYPLNEIQQNLYLLSSLRTLISFFIIGLSIYMASFFPHLGSISLAILVVPYFISIIALTGYVISSAKLYYEFEGIGLSIPTALSVILLIFSTILGPVRKAGNGFLIAPGVGGKSIRILLPTALLFPPLGTWIILFLNRQGLISLNVSFALQTVTPCFILALIVGYVGPKFTKKEREIEEAKIIQKSLENLNRSKDNFLAILSHELRTPMNSVLGFLDLLNDYKQGTKEYNKVLEIIKKNARAELLLIETILDISRFVTGKKQLPKKIFNLYNLLETIFASMEIEFLKKNLNTSIKNEATETEYLGNEEHIGQVIRNLLSNAIKFTPEKGHVSLSLSSVNSNYLIKILDSGIGMSQEQIKHIFDFFWQADTTLTRSFGGLGIGLSYSDQIIKAHDGAISANSEGTNKGSEFIIMLPIKPTTA
jgi:signal transduction histidine kinase